MFCGEKLGCTKKHSRTDQKWFLSYCRKIDVLAQNTRQKKRLIKKGKPHIWSTQGQSTEFLILTYHIRDKERTLSNKIIDQGGNNTKSTAIFIKIKILIQSKDTMLDHFSIIVNHGKQFYSNKINESCLLTNVKTIRLYESTASLTHRRNIVNPCRSN